MNQTLLCLIDTTHECVGATRAPSPVGYPTAILSFLHAWGYHMAWWQSMWWPNPMPPAMPCTWHPSLSLCPAVMAIQANGLCLQHCLPLINLCDQLEISNNISYLDLIPSFSIHPLSGEVACVIFYLFAGPWPRKFGLQLVSSQIWFPYELSLG